MDFQLLSRKMAWIEAPTIPLIGWRAGPLLDQKGRSILGRVAGGVRLILFPAVPSQTDLVRGTAMDAKAGRQEEQFFVVAVSATGLALLASTVQDVFGFAFGDLRNAPRVWLLDVDVERSLSTWLSILLLGSASFLLFDIWSRAKPSKFRFVWLTLAVFFVGLSFDEFASLHERVSDVLHRRFHTSGLFAFAWAAPAGILSILGLLALWPFLRRLPPNVVSALVLSAVLFLAGAVGMELIGGKVAEDQTVFSPLYRLCVTVEEGLEQIGLLLFIHTLLRHRAVLVDTA